MKKTLALLLATLFLLAAGCARDMNWVISNEPCIRGTVEQIGEDYILIRVSQADELPLFDGDLVRTERATRLQDCKFSAKIGDEVAVYYDNDALVTFGEVPEVGAIHGYCLITPAERENGEAG